MILKLFNDTIATAIVMLPKMRGGGIIVSYDHDLFCRTMPKFAYSDCERKSLKFNLNAPRFSVIQFGGCYPTILSYI
jgi:hypothetical protein